MASANPEERKQTISHITGHDALLPTIKRALKKNGIVAMEHLNGKSGQMDGLVIDFNENRNTLLPLVIRQRISDLTAIPTSQDVKGLQKIIVDNLSMRVKNGETTHYQLAKEALQRLVNTVQREHPTHQAVIKEAFHEKRSYNPESTQGLQAFVQLVKAKNSGVAQDGIRAAANEHLANAKGKPNYFDALTPKGFKIEFEEREERS
ncbi:MAG: hypothetical protein WCX64_01500 [Candidatus Micrarchaeia archaeon]|jgi:hypothetical protein